MTKHLDKRISELESKSETTTGRGKVRFIWIMTQGYRDPTPEEATSLEEETIRRNPGDSAYLISWPPKAD